MCATEEKEDRQKNGDKPQWSAGKGTNKRKKNDNCWLRRRNMVERRECPTGMRVYITGGIYKKHGYVGKIAGSTRCMVDVFLPVLKRIVRVRRTSVESASAEAEETTMEDPPSWQQPSVAEAVARDELLRTSLADVCVRLTRHGFNAGDPDIYKMVDAIMTAVSEIEKEIK
jgi:hypothetical protein